MTTAQRKGLEVVLLLLGSVATVAFSTGYARREVEAKEDARDHVADVRDLYTKLSEERQLREIQLVRDSAQMAKMLDRITDVACDGRRRSYCPR